MRYWLIKTGAYAALFWERLWRALWPAACLVTTLFALALLGVWQALPAILSAPMLALLLAVTIVAIVSGLWRLRLPARHDVLRWMEQRHGLAHRPLTMAEDSQATPETPASSVLWQEHQARSETARSSLGFKLPHPGIARRDPWALRMLTTLVLFVAILVGGSQWRESLAFLGSPPFGYPGEEAVVTAWLDPPQYTGRPPRTLDLTTETGEELTVMDVIEGTVLHVRVSGPRRTPVLDGPDDRRALAEEQARSYATTFDLASSGEYSVEIGSRQLAMWRIDVSDDLAPIITFAGEPTQTARQSLHLEYVLEDDFGAVEGEAVFTRSGAEDEEPLRLALPLPAPRPGVVTGSTYQNLTAHPWAGSSVLAHLEVADSAGQEGRSETISFILPEREFTHPVAQELIKLRKLVSTEPDSGPFVSRQLGLLTTQPKRFDDDLVVYMAIRTAAYRVTDPDQEVVDQMVSLMWDTAVRIEDGTLSVAEARMREALQQLQDSLSDENADPEQTAELMQQLRQAMADYMQALAEQQAQSGESQAQQNDNQQQRGDARNAMDQMMQQIQNLAELGAMDDAQQMLSQLQAMMENLKASQAGGQQGAEQRDAARQALNNLRQQQQQLMDDTFNEASRQAPGQAPQDGGQPGGESPNTPQPGSAAGLGDRQEDLKAGLMATTQQMDQNAAGQGALSQAVEAMQQAVEQLGQGRLDDAVNSQARAVQSLAEAEDAMSQQSGQAENAGSSEGNGQGMGQTDPGRSVIPAESDLGRAREILDEIRRRAGQWERPEVELEYLERLLDRF